MEIFIAIVVVGIIVLIAKSDISGKLPNPYHARNCEGRKWRTMFSQYSKLEIREFLELFVEAFAYDSAEKLKFNPDDRIMDIYRAQYSSKDTPDALELETLVKEVNINYDVALADHWHENMTLGELFMLTRESHNAA